MLLPTLLFLLSSITPPTAAIVKSQFPTGIKGFNYDAHDDFTTLFPKAKALGFNAARTFTAIAPDSNPPQPLSAFAAAQASGTNLLIGLYLSAGNASFQFELQALEAAITKYGDALFPSKIIGITVGNEDVYRQQCNDPKLGAGDSVANILDYVSQTRNLLKTHGLDTKIPIGHAETWSQWKNETIASQLLPHLDYAALNSFPYWEGQDIKWAKWAYDGAVSVSEASAQKFKNGNDVVPIWATETGWPTQGKTIGQATANLDNAKAYWKSVGCGSLFGKKRNSFWFRLYGIGGGVDAGISWGVADQGGKALFDLNC